MDMQDFSPSDYYKMVFAMLSVCICTYLVPELVKISSILGWCLRILTFQLQSMVAIQICPKT
jgi:hypothetical protein